VAFCRFLVGVSHHTVSHLPYLLAIEYVGVKSRVWPLLVMMASYSAASCLTPFAASAMADWRPLLLLSCLPNVLMIVLGWKWLPESPSWLLCKGKIDDAKKVLTKVAKVNRNYTQVRKVPFNASTSVQTSLR